MARTATPPARRQPTRAPRRSVIQFTGTRPHFSDIAAGLRRGAGGATLVRMPGAGAQLGRRAAVSLHLVLPAIPAGVPLVRHRLRGPPASPVWPTPASTEPIRVHPE